jgi:hypothetical protein
MPRVLELLLEMHEKTTLYIHTTQSDVPYHVVPEQPVKLINAIETCVYSITTTYYEKLAADLRSGRLENINKDKLRRFMNFK